MQLQKAAMQMARTGNAPTQINANILNLYFGSVTLGDAEVNSHLRDGNEQFSLMYSGHHRHYHHHHLCHCLHFS